MQKLHQKDDKIKSLYVQISDIETDKMEDNSEEEKIEKRIDEAVARQKSQITKEITEELNSKHKKEIEALRQRFKLMTCTNMERSPSDTSLEKIDVRVRAFLHFIPSLTDVTLYDNDEFFRLIAW